MVCENKILAHFYSNVDGHIAVQDGGAGGNTYLSTYLVIYRTLLAKVCY